MDYRFFQFTTKNFTDYTSAGTLKEAKEIFKFYYPELEGKVREIWMSSFSHKKLHKNGSNDII